QLRDMVDSWLSRPGRPMTEITKHKDVQIYLSYLKAARDQTFRTAADMYRDRKKANNYTSDDSLIERSLAEMGLAPAAIDAIVEAGGRHQRAVTILVASQCGCEQKSVAVMASRGRKRVEEYRQLTY